jgi:hypothetical protein
MSTVSISAPRTTHERNAAIDMVPLAEFEAENGELPF